MTREQIKNAADEFAEMEYEINYIDRDALSKGFFHGSYWRIDSVWHNVSERPKFPGKVECVKFLLLRKNGECDRYLIGKYNWDDIIDMEKPIKWAYIDDLIPEVKEETNGSC